ELGDGTTSDTRTTPVTPTGLSSGVADVQARSDITCALMTSGGVKCWGNNSVGQLGEGTHTTDQTTPTDGSGLSSRVSHIGVGWNDACAALTAGGAECWGANQAGEVGDGTSGMERDAPVPVHNLSATLSQISEGAAHTCAVTTAGALKCWGDN